MADAVGNKAAKDYHFDVPAPDQGFFARGLGHTDWGMKNRISHLFSLRPATPSCWPSTTAI